MSSDVDIQGLLSPGHEVTDWGRMRDATVRSIARPTTEAELQQVVRHAGARGLKVSIRGAGHSAGGHSFIDDGIMVDMRDLAEIIELDGDKKTVRVQAGASWEVLTRALEPLRLAVTTKQEFDNFTVGGSVAANVHGKTVDYGPLIESIVSLRLLKADGEIVTVSREENTELFRAVIGGYGLLGIVVDVTFQLVDDRPVEKSAVVFMNVEPLVESYIERVRRDPESTPLCYGFFNPRYTRGFYVTYVYAEDGRERGLDELKRDETNPTLFSVFVWLQRRFGFIRSRAFHIMWGSSNKAEVTLRSRRLLLWDQPPKAFDDLLLQKYFVPVDNFASFIRRVSEVFEKYKKDLPVMTNHFRFVPGNGEALLSFHEQDTICLIPVYLARKDDERWVGRLEQATGELLDACLDEGGSYYLTFDTIASREQLERAYPQWGDVLALKAQHDPTAMFSSLFYEKYAAR